MITPGMEEPRVTNEILLDFSEAIGFSDTKDEKLSRLIAKSKQFPFYAYSNFVSSRKNRWMILYESDNRKRLHDDIQIIFVCLFYDAQVS